MCIIAERADQTLSRSTLSRSTLSRSTLSRSGVEPPTGTIHPRKNPATESPCPRCPLSFPSVLSRSGVEPPTGTIHPRESRETADRKQVKRFTSDNTFQNLELLEPVGGCTPDRNDPPPQNHFLPLLFFPFFRATGLSAGFVSPSPSPKAPELKYPPIPNIGMLIIRSIFCSARCWALR